jgi:hypothetical protein
VVFISWSHIVWLLLLSFLMQGARVLFECAGHFYEQLAIVSDWSTAHTIAATRTDRGMPEHLMTMTEFHEAPAVQSYFGLASFWLASSNIGVGGTWLWTAGRETGIAVPPYMAPASEITVKQCALYSGFNVMMTAALNSALSSNMSAISPVLSTAAMV